MSFVVVVWLLSLCAWTWFLFGTSTKILPGTTQKQKEKIRYSKISWQKATWSCTWWLFLGVWLRILVLGSVAFQWKCIWFVLVLLAKVTISDNAKTRWSCEITKVNQQASDLSEPFYQTNVRHMSVRHWHVWNWWRVYKDSVGFHSWFYGIPRWWCAPGKCTSILSEKCMVATKELTKSIFDWSHRVAPVLDSVGFWSLVTTRERGDVHLANAQHLLLSWIV